MLFDVVLFDAAGNVVTTVSAGVPLHGAVACARGCNSQGAKMVAVVVPANTQVAKESE